MAQKRYFEFEADDLTIDLDRWNHGIVMPGVYQGFDFGTQTDMNLKIVHSVTGTKYITKEPAAESNFVGVIKTRQEVVINEDEPLADIPISAADPSLPRIDTIYITHEYVDSTDGQPAYYGVVEGTPDATPFAPAVPNPLTDMVIATLFIPAGITSLADLGVVYTRAEVPTIANENYAHRNKINRYTKSAQEASENDDCTFNTGTGRLTINDESNSFELPNTVTTVSPLSTIDSKPSGTIIRLRVTTALGIKVTHQTSPTINQIYNLVDQETIEFPEGTILYLQSHADGHWTIIDYSLKAVFDRINVYSKPSQRKYGTGIRFKPVSFVVSSITYNTWILEIDASAPNHVLDLTNSDQLNGLNLSSLPFFALSLNFIELINFKTEDLGVGNGADITIKVIGAIHTMFGGLSSYPNPIQNGNYAYLDNVQDIARLGYNNSGTPVCTLYDVTNLTNGTGSFTVRVMNSSKYHIFPNQAIAKTIGGIEFSNELIIGSDSHKAALDLLGDKLVGTYGANASWTANTTAISSYTVGSTTLRYQVIGKMVFFALNFGGTASAGSGVDLFSFDLTVPFGTAVSNGGIGIGEASDTSNDLYIRCSAGITGAGKIRVSGVYNADGTSKTVNGNVMGWYLTN